MYLSCEAKYFLFLAAVVTCVHVEGLQRKLISHVNPDCEIPQCKFHVDNQSVLNLIHVEAIGPKDTIHYLWSTINLPSLVIAQTSNVANLEINWSDILELKNGALWFTEDPIQSIGLILTQLWSYVDEEDTADMSQSNNVKNLNVSDFFWKAVSAPVLGSDSILSTLIVSSGNEAIFADNGKFKVEFSAGSSAERSQVYPHLGFTGNSTQMRILFNDLAIDKKERLAAEFMAISSLPSKDAWTPVVRSSIDDEYSPGVFKVNLLYPPSCEKCKDKGSFLMWKPVAYLGDKPTVVNSSDAIMSEIMNATTIPTSLVSMFFNNSKETSNIAWNMTFGTSGDGFYERTKYTAWSIMVGTGSPVFEELSVLAKVVIAVGLGAPCVIILGGGVFLCYKKCRKDDDELLLTTAY